MKNGPNIDIEKRNIVSSLKTQTTLKMFSQSVLIVEFAVNDKHTKWQNIYIKKNGNKDIQTYI